MTEEKQKQLALPNNNFYLRPSFVKGIDNESEKIKLSLLSFKDGKVSLTDVWKVITNPNVVRQILAYKFSLNVTFKYADLFFVTEQIPNFDSSVTLSDQKDKWGYPISRVNWQVTKYDIDSMRVWFKLLLTELFPRESYKFTHTINDFNWEDIFTSAIHHVGTARIGNGENDGVVNANLKVFGLDNLYICDGSIFTTAGNVNNGFTISAFACRLAEYLKKDL
nr:GMC family oxidoreductase [Seleniivibrio sp.]